MADCIFCKLANGEIPTATLYENDEFRVILDAGPATKGHCLILPKAHYADVCEMPEDLTGRAFILAKKVGMRMARAMKSDGLNLVQNNRACAGQSVFHFHIHVIPRYEGGDQIVANWKPGELTDEAKEEILTAFDAVQ